MKPKRLSAFAVIHTRNGTQGQQRKKETKSPTSNPIQKKKRSSLKVAITPRHAKPKQSTSYLNLDKSPIMRSTRSSSCPNLIDEPITTRQGSVSPRKFPKKEKKAGAKNGDMKNERISMITRKSVELKAAPVPCLNENEGKDGKEAKSTDFTALSDNNADALKCFDWLIHPVKIDKFFSDLWESKPLLVKRHSTTYYKGILTCAELDSMLREKPLYFSKNVDITTYVDGKRETHNPRGRAYPRLVWDYYSNGCSVRLLNPQTFSKAVWKLTSLLQDYFGSFVGANVYLTPAGTQGFAPHYDDIEAFVLQLEGRKRWKLYNPRSDTETLPRFSSGNFTDGDIGEPILNVELEPGDLLYFPRGTIHQASTPDDTHSLHLTISTYQRNSWADFLEKLLPRALETAIEEDSELREGLPRNYLEYVGVAHSDEVDPRRTHFFENLSRLMSKVFECATVDACADQMGKSVIHDCLPPLLSKAERAHSIHGTKECWKNGPTSSMCCLTAEDRVRLVRANILRLVTEGEEVLVYHSIDNSREYHEEEPQFFEISCEFAPAVELLVHAYPKFVAIRELPLENLQDRVIVANLLYERGLLLTKNIISGEAKSSNV